MAEKQADRRGEDASEWSVSFESGLLGKHAGARPGREIPVRKRFSWAGHEWVIPAVYLCGRGLVVDFCMRVSAEELRPFLDKWLPMLEDEEGGTLTAEQQMQLNLENPLDFEFVPLAVVNGKELSMTHGCGTCSNPYWKRAGPHGVTDRRIIAHYRLDASSGWMFYRASFAWSTKRRPRNLNLLLKLKQRPASFPGPHFASQAPGDCVTFCHPSDGMFHTLTVRQFERQELSADCFPDAENWEYPPHFCMMCYTVEPELPDGALELVDCDGGDSPRKRRDLSHTSAAGAATIGIIGGSFGPVAIVAASPTAERRREDLRAVCSSLHFAPRERVEWRIVFRQKQFEDVSLQLLQPAAEKTEGAQEYDV